MNRILVQRHKKGFDVLCQIQHPMEPGGRLDPVTGRQLGANYITQVAFRRNDEIQAEVLLGRHVSANPVIGVGFAKLAKGDRISVSWQDINGSSRQIDHVYTGSDE